MNNFLPSGTIVLIKPIDNRYHRYDRIKRHSMHTHVGAYIYAQQVCDMNCKLTP